MATIQREVRVAAPAAEAWAAIRDFGAVHRRVVPGFVLDCRMEGDARVLTFANSLVTREQLVGIDDAARRLAYRAASERLTHHNGSVQVFDGDGGNTRLVWTIDVLPDAAAPAIRAMVEQGAAAMQRALGAPPQESI